MWATLADRTNLLAWDEIQCPSASVSWRSQELTRLCSEKWTRHPLGGSGGGVREGGLLGVGVGGLRVDKA